MTNRDIHGRRYVALSEGIDPNEGLSGEVGEGVARDYAAAVGARIRNLGAYIRVYHSDGTRTDVRGYMEALDVLKRRCPA